MKNFHVLILFFMPFFIQGQNTLNADDLPQVGDVFSSVDCDIPTGFSIGSSGANQTYDFSMLTPTDTFINNFISPNGTAGFSEFPSATLAGEFDGDYVYYQQTNSEFLFLGLYSDTSANGIGQYLATQFTPPSKVFQIPSTYNTAYTNSSGWTNTLADDSGFADSIRTTVSFVDDVLFDGYGTVITPNGSFDGLRERRISTVSSLFEIYSSGVWTVFLNSSETDTSYNWYGENNIDLASVNIFDGEIINISYSIAGVQTITPVSDFDSNDLGGGVINFNDNSTNSPTSWLWDFGDGSTSTQQNPQHTYTSAGSYNVCLTASNSSGSNTICKDVVISFAPIAAFTFSISNNGIVDFSDGSTNSPTSWLWDFGDGNTSTQQNPQHTYTAAGTHNVCLTATNSIGSSVTCLDVTIEFIPVSAFTFNIQSNGMVEFTDASTNSPTSWLWDFGDGNTSTEQNPQYTYSTSDMYNVCLTVTNGAGSHMNCETVNVIISATDDISNSVNVEIYPNPMNQVLNILLENQNRESLDFQLMNSVGQQVLNLKLETIGSYSIDVKNLETGMYYYTFQDSNGQIRKRGRLVKGGI